MLHNHTSNNVKRLQQKIKTVWLSEEDAAEDISENEISITINADGSTSKK